MKQLKYIFALLFAGVFVFQASAVAGTAPWSNSNSTGDGEPPGWSQLNPGNGGSDGPGEGPKNSDDESAYLSCLSAIASQNPVLILEACDFLDEEGVQRKVRARNRKIIRP